MIKTILIDDESSCTEGLSQLLNSEHPDVYIEGIYNKSKEGLKAILSLKPDLVFLDVEMPFMNGFDVLEALPEINFDVIFTTAYDKYALQAIKFSALDYLLKPVDPEDLQIAMEKISKNNAKVTHNTQIQYNQLFNNLKGLQNSYNKITIQSNDGMVFINISDIIRCEADGNYTKIYTANGQLIVSSKTLKEYENMLESVGFSRVHNSDLINLNHVKRYIKGDGGQVIMTDNTTVEVSRRRKEQFLSRLS